MPARIEGETFRRVDARGRFSLTEDETVIEQVADLMMSKMDAAISSISSGSYAGHDRQGKSFRSS